MKLTREAYQEILFEESEDFELVTEQFYNKGRWESTDLVVFKRGDELWGFYHNYGNTEYQEAESPAEVECFRVKEVQTVTYEVAR